MNRGGEISRLFEHIATRTTAFLFCAALILAFSLSARPARADEPTRPTATTGDSLRAGVGTARENPAPLPTTTATKTAAFLRPNAQGVQTRYPSVCKIVGRAATQAREDGVQTTPVYYGTGVYVAEFGACGIVLTNWHVVSESDAGVDVLFPTRGLFSARVILRDETWDLAALLIERPAGILPIPISLEVPKLGETFWVGGYGQTSGLDDFQLRAGRLQNYVSLVDPEEPTGNVGGGVDAALPSAGAGQGVYLRPPPQFKRALYETLSIKRGVRRGDSGGPIFNRYGELAGVLWGSDGKSTMGTVDLRLQEFLTQAIRRTARYCAEQSLDATESGATFDERAPVALPLSGVVDADGTELSMYDALLRDGVFSISSCSVYVSADASISAESLARSTREEALKKVVNASIKAAQLDSEGPPYPPVYSPTFVVQQRETKQISPEKIDPEVAARLNEVVLAQVTQERASRQTSKTDELAVAQATITEAKSLNVAMKSIDVSDESADVAFESDPRGENLENAEEESKVDLGEDKSDAESDKGLSGEEASEHDGVRLSNIQTYALFCILFIVFYLAARGMNIESDVERKKNKKIRLRND